jgi:hypothetical protein
MYSPQACPEEQLGQYTVQYLQNKENANKIFEEVKALKVFDYIKSVITLDKKDILFTDFNKLERITTVHFLKYISPKAFACKQMLLCYKGKSIPAAFMRGLFLLYKLIV